MKIVLIFLLLMLSGCRADEAVYFEKATETNSSNYEVYIENKNISDIFDNVKTGSEIYNSTKFPDISEFEEYMGVSQDIYSMSLTLGEKVPLSFLMDTYINGKMPIIRIFPPKDTNMYSLGSLILLAKDLGSIDIPIILDFYPVYSELYDINEYKRYYKTAYETFKTYAPNVSLIWSIDAGMAGESFIYYPGDEFVSAVGADVTVSSRDIEKPLDTLFGDLSFLNYSFQGTKPLIISSLKVSHYSAESLSYTTTEAGKIISEVYSFVKEYPAFKAVIYSDADYTKNVFKTGENFSVSDTIEIRKAYRKIVSDFSKNKENIRGCMRSWYFAKKENGEFYIPAYMAVYELGMSFNWEESIPLSQLSLKYTVDEKNKRLYIVAGI
ncbi:MAG: glycosyl hydrolase [Lachnospiraceae bacterium]|nr:glycosyl hydrolase [Lachnospiraceae bacterium]